MIRFGAQARPWSYLGYLSVKLANGNWSKCHFYYYKYGYYLSWYQYFLDICRQLGSGELNRWNSFVYSSTYSITNNNYNNDTTTTNYNNNSNNNNTKCLYSASDINVSKRNTQIKINSSKINITINAINITWFTKKIKYYNHNWVN